MAAAAAATDGKCDALMLSNDGLIPGSGSSSQQDEM